ncbi:MAG: hypothetical protein VKJ04_02670 [Vampirovibrionales bacterium]|nr:hypothetical protein [Vampirovibrionales bacterium]
MNQPLPVSKLFIRSEVLAVIEFLSTFESPTKQDKLKQLKRLSQLEDRQTVLQVLVKELPRASGQSVLQSIGELLMELGDIENLKDPLWKMIEANDVEDDIKDTAHLVLRQLGDQSDPSLYLDYLEDPEGLINRETERMLDVASKNPEALIDFIDFIFSLPVDEQCNLIRSLQQDHPAESLVNIYLPTLDAQPPFELAELILSSLGQTKSPRAALYLHDLKARNSVYVNGHQKLQKAAQKSLNELKLSGIYKANELEANRSQMANAGHPLTTESTLHECYATLPDGIGNQGLIISRQQKNGDITMMCVAVNDIHGIMDCFGFYQLTETDFHKLVRKFHEDCSKIPVPAAYCRQRLSENEILNDKQQFRIPYEYRCWEVMLGDVEADAELNPEALCIQWANLEWHSESANLYHHPDFATWFLEEGDHPVVTEILQQVVGAMSQDALNHDLSKDDFQLQMEVLSELLMRGLLSGEWRLILKNRLAQAAYLLKQQDAHTFASLAATEVIQLDSLDLNSTIALKSGFMLYYGRRCVEEALLRFKHDTQCPAHLLPYIDHVLSAWQV